MKRNDFKKAKTDYVFMIVLIILLIGILLCSLLFKVKQDNISIEDLPDNFTFSTNKLIISEVVSSNKGIYSNEKIARSLPQHTVHCKCSLATCGESL